MSGRRNNLPARLVRNTGSIQYYGKQKEVFDLSFKKQPFRFSKDLRLLSNNKQNDLLNYFEKQVQNLNPIYLNNNDFKNGTLRITKPGLYKLRENIVFNPRNFFPTPDQFEKYPVGKNGPYHLGFFAAIALEADNVIIDLNGYSIIQSKEHNLMQRFFSLIELANSPFIPKQGPHSFISDFIPANKCLIMNGTLAESSHHCIHGNANSEVVIYNTVMTAYEVAAVALNGATHSIIADNLMVGKSNGIPVLSSFSQAVFLLRTMKEKGEEESKEYLALERDILQAKSEILAGKPQTTYFHNKTGKYDGNMYGVVLNVRGVVINDFLKKRKGDDKILGNIDNLVALNRIRDIVTHPVEIIALRAIGENGNSSTQTAYGGKRMVGPFGDVFDIEKVMDSDKKYIGNSLSNAQLLMAQKYPDLGTINIDLSVLDWSQQNSPLPSLLNFVVEGDSMGHHMKGNIGIFISGGKNIILHSNYIENVECHGLSVGTSPLLKEDERYFTGADVYGILMTASQNIVLRDNSGLYVRSHQRKSKQKKIDIINKPGEGK